MLISQHKHVLLHVWNTWNEIKEEEQREKVTEICLMGEMEKDLVVPWDSDSCEVGLRSVI